MREVACLAKVLPECPFCEIKLIHSTVHGYYKCPDCGGEWWPVDKIEDEDISVLWRDEQAYKRSLAKKGASASSGNLEKTDISGSNNIPNKADYILAVERNWDPSSDCNAIITSLKDRNGGQRKPFKFRFSQETLRFYNSITPQEREYGWIGQANKPPWEVGE